MVNQIYGEEINHEGDLIVYYEATKRKGISGEPGNIFLVQAKGEFGSLNILVCTTGGTVDEVLVKDSPVVDGKAVVPGEFLGQFIRRSLQDSWEVAQTPSDLVILPSKIRPIADQPMTSNEVAMPSEKS